MLDVKAEIDEKALERTVMDAFGSYMDNHGLEHSCPGCGARIVLKTGANKCPRCGFNVKVAKGGW